jgi:2-polyprenyl-3-methyl-5-hydroxy-6-metoxy-1,4-benzoquinol methylase
MWNERYAEPGYAYGTEPNDFLVDMVGKIPRGGRVLEIAAGEGRNAVWLAEQGLEVTAVDSSSVGVEKTMMLAKDRGVKLKAVTGDLASFELPVVYYDGVVSIFAHLPPDVRRAVHARVVTGLAPGGVLILEAYSPAQLALKTGGPPVEEMLYTLEALEDELAGLELEVARAIERPVVEGKYHTGKAAVVQVLARKPAWRS